MTESHNKAEICALESRPGLGGLPLDIIDSVPGKHLDWPTFPTLVGSLVAACPSAALTYLLVLQTHPPSLRRLALTALLVPILALTGYQARPDFSSRNRSVLMRLLVAAFAASILAGLGLIRNPEKSYLFAGQHILRIEPVRISDGQSVEVRWFTTELGDVSLNSFENQGGWRLDREGLRLASSKGGVLVWQGFTGTRSTLTLAATPGVVLRILWDGQSREVDFTETRGRTRVQTTFPISTLGLSGLGLLLLLGTLYPGIIIVLGDRHSNRMADFPPIARHMVLGGIYTMIILVSWKLPGDSVALAWLVAAVLVLILPGWHVSTWYHGQSGRSLVHRVAAFLARHSKLCILIGSLSFAIGLFGHSLWINWTMFDDHQIMQYVGPGRGLSLGMMWTALPRTEFGLFGQSLRFRPTYWFLRLLECVVWGARPYLWHAFRVLILVLALGLFWGLLAPVLGWIDAGLMCAYTLTFAYWQQIFGWLGPGETYAVGGLALYAWGTVNLFKHRSQDPRRSLFATAAVLMGTILCAGSKENFTLLALPSMFTGLHALRRRDWIGIVAAVGSVCFAAYVAVGVLPAILHRGSDVYTHSVAPSARAAAIAAGLDQIQVMVPVATLLILAFSWSIVWLSVFPTSARRRGLGTAAAWMALLAVLLLSQVVFYNGVWPTGIRYDFPGMLYIPATAVILMYYAMQGLPKTAGPVLRDSAKAALGIALGILVVSRGYGGTVRFVDNWVSSSNKFVESIEHTAAVLRAHPDYAVVLESSSVGDYEAVFSYKEFLNAYGARNSFFLRLHGYSVDTAIYAQEQNLVSQLTKVSVDGTEGFLPLTSLESFGGRCYSLVLSGKVDTTCVPIN